MKLLILAEDFPPNVSGGARTRWAICNRAEKRGHDVVAVTPHTPGLPTREVVNGVQILRPFRLRAHATPSHSSLSTIMRLVLSPIFLLASILTVGRSLRDVDAILSTSNSMHWIGRVLAGLSSANHVAFVGYSPLVDPGRHSQFRRWLAQLNVRFVLPERVACRSVSVADALSSQGRRATVAHGIVDEDMARDVGQSSVQEHRESVGIEAEGRLLVFVGRLTPIKRPSLALDIIASLQDDTRLVVVGDGTERAQLEDSIAKRGLTGQVETVGEVPPKRALRYMAAADAVIVTSEAESYCSVGLEGLALGRHVVSTEVGVLTDIDHERLHLGQPEELAELVKLVPQDTPLQVDEQILQRFGMQRFTREMLEILEPS